MTAIKFLSKKYYRTILFPINTLTIYPCNKLFIFRIVLFEYFLIILYALSLK